MKALTAHGDVFINSFILDNKIKKV